MGLPLITIDTVTTNWTENGIDNHNPILDVSLLNEKNNGLKLLEDGLFVSDSNPFQQATVPTPTAYRKTWIDTSASPPIHKFYDGNDWIPTGTGGAAAPLCNYLSYSNQIQSIVGLVKTVQPFTDTIDAAILMNINVSRTSSANHAIVIPDVALNPNNGPCYGPCRIQYEFLATTLTAGYKLIPLSDSADAVFLYQPSLTGLAVETIVSVTFRPVVTVKEANQNLYPLFQRLPIINVFITLF